MVTSRQSKEQTTGRASQQRNVVSERQRRCVKLSEAELKRQRARSARYAKEVQAEYTRWRKEEAARKKFNALSPARKKLAVWSAAQKEFAALWTGILELEAMTDKFSTMLSRSANLRELAKTSPDLADITAESDLFKDEIAMAIKHGWKCRDHPITVRKIRSFLKRNARAIPANARVKLAYFDNSGLLRERMVDHIIIAPWGDPSRSIEDKLYLYLMDHHGAGYLSSPYASKVFGTTGG